MFEGPAQISKKKEMEAKHDLELERTKNKRELQHCDYEKQKADEKNNDLERRNRELDQKASSMEHQKMAGEHTKEVQQAEIDRLNEANDKEDREAARDQEDLKK